MYEQEKLVVNALKAFATELLREDAINVDDVIDRFTTNAHVAFSPEGRDELVNHLNSLL